MKHCFSGCVVTEAPKTERDIAIEICESEIVSLEKLLENAKARLENLKVTP